MKLQISETEVMFGMLFALREARAAMAGAREIIIQRHEVPFQLDFAMRMVDIAIEKAESQE